MNYNDGWNTKPLEWEKEPDKLKKQMLNYKSVSVIHDLDESYIKDLDTIFVLAGGLTDNGKVHEWVMRRLDLAFHIYKTHRCKLICLGGGTYHKPPILNDSSYVVHESTACVDYLINLGVNPNDIYKEWASYDTIANGYFAYTNFILPMDLKNIMIITSEFHMLRTKAIFRWIIRLDNKLNNLNMSFVSASDNGLPEDIINVRRMREKESLKNLCKVFKNISTIKEFHRWFYEDHKAYCSHSHVIKKEGDEINNDEKKSY